jgi:hypothetical protein
VFWSDFSEIRVKKTAESHIPRFASGLWTLSGSQRVTDVSNAVKLMKLAAER